MNSENYKESCYGLNLDLLTKSCVSYSRRSRQVGKSNNLRPIYLNCRFQCRVPNFKERSLNKTWSPNVSERGMPLPNLILSSYKRVWQDLHTRERFDVSRIRTTVLRVDEISENQSILFLFFKTQTWFCQILGKHCKQALWNSELKPKSTYHITIANEGLQ